jgi:hypothetical protein
MSNGCPMHVHIQRDGDVCLSKDPRKERYSRQLHQQRLRRHIRLLGLSCDGSKKPCNDSALILDKLVTFDDI